MPFQPVVATRQHFALQEQPAFGKSDAQLFGIAQCDGVLDRLENGEIERLVEFRHIAGLCVRARVFFLEPFAAAVDVCV